MVDLSDEPVLDERSRFRLVAHALAAGTECDGRPSDQFRVESRDETGTGGRNGDALCRSWQPFRVIDHRRIAALSRDHHAEAIEAGP